jgi:hypothetical protein
VFFLTVLVYGFGVAIVRIQRLRASLPVRRGGSALALVVMMFTFAVVLFQLPYRVEWKNAMPRIEVAGERCYAIGKQADDWLIYCPDRTPPRNRVVRRNDPAVHDLGVVQSIFTPPETSP